MEQAHHYQPELPLFDETTRINGGVDYAISHGCNIDDETARLIAGMLAHEGSALAALAASGTVDYVQLRRELLDIYASERTPQQVRQWCDQLDTYSIERASLGDVQTVQGGDRDNAASLQTQDQHPPLFVVINRI